MEYRQIFGNSSRFIVWVGLSMSVLLVVLEIIIGVQYSAVDPGMWQIGLLVASLVVLDILFLVELFSVKKYATRIVFYCVDFALLVIVCSLTGSTYISAIYCVILSQLYINVDSFRAKLSVFIGSCVAFIVTTLIGWMITQGMTLTGEQIIGIVSGCVVGLIILAVHFVVANFIISYHNTNLKLVDALKEAEDNKNRLEEAYRELSQTAVYEERNRIARDIHDNAGHSITSVIMLTEAAKLLIDSDPKQAKAKMVSANIQAKNALNQMRESVHLLAGRDSSVTLKDELQETIAGTMDGTDIKIRYDIDDVSLPYDKRRFMGNCLKELLANGMRHGGATAFYVELKSDGETVKLTVSDNGSGLPADFKEGFGLKGIREKAALFGGGVFYESQEGEGVEVTVKINLNGEE